MNTPEPTPLPKATHQDIAINSAFATLLNRLSAMQESPYYAVARPILSEVEQVIVRLERQLAEAKRELEDANAELIAQASTSHGQMLAESQSREVEWIAKWSDSQNKLHAASQQHLTDQQRITQLEESANRDTDLIASMNEERNRMIGQLTTVEAEKERLRAALDALKAVFEKEAGNTVFISIADEERVRRLVTDALTSPPTSPCADVTAREQWLWDNCRIVYFPPVQGAYPIEHTMAANKDSRMFFEKWMPPACADVVPKALYDEACEQLGNLIKANMFLAPEKDALRERVKELENAGTFFLSSLTNGDFETACKQFDAVLSPTPKDQSHES